MEVTIDAEYKHLDRVSENFEIKKWGEYHNLCDPSNTFLLADVFQYFSNNSIEIHRLDPTTVFSALGLAWPATLKK